MSDVDTRLIIEANRQLRGRLDAAEAERDRYRAVVDAATSVAIEARWVKNIAEADYGMHCDELHRKLSKFTTARDALAALTKEGT
jgi:hypothetical protein